jgi:uncharacterized protein
MTAIAASMLYDYVACPHRVSMDLFADPATRDHVSPFVQLLWDRGFAHEREVIRALELPLIDLSGADDEEKEKHTLQAMARGEPLIYGGRISSIGLVGMPDLLRHQDGGYVAGDIKSGSADEGGSDDDDGKPKVHYAVQVALYTDILEQLGMSAGRNPFIWDVKGREVVYDLNAPYGVRNPRTLWQDYQECLAAVKGVLGGAETLPAYSSACKNCVWYSACLAVLEKANDLTLIPFLGRSLRDAMRGTIATMQDLAEINPDGFITDKGKKTVFPGLGPDRLRKFQTRAKLVVTKDSKPYLSAPISLPNAERELFFDIEVDPMRDICYLHGFVERTGGENTTESFSAFFAEDPTPEAEKRAFSDAWLFMKGRHPCGIYYYSKYERTIYRKLRNKYPDVCAEDELEALFDPASATDLYFDVVLKATEWPTRDFSIKTLAKHLGFSWRDTHPSGAASIEWFHRWVETRDQSIRQRILDYNEDDCRATRVLLDGIRALAN